VYYQANDSAMAEEEYFRATLNGTKREPAPDKFERAYSLSPDEKLIVYEDKGDIWIANPDFTHKRQLVETKLAEYNATWAPDSRRIAFVQDGDVWMINVKNSKLTQVTSKKDDDPGYSIVEWAGDDKLVLVQWDTSAYKTYYFPEYVGQYVKPGTTHRGVASQLVSVSYLDSLNTKQIYEHKGYTSNRLSDEGRYVA